MPQSSEDLGEITLAWFRMQLEKGNRPAFNQIIELARRGEFEAQTLLIEQVSEGNQQIIDLFTDLARRESDDLIFSLLKKLEQCGNQLVLIQLVQLASRGDQRAYDTLYRYYYHLTYALTYGMVASREEAEDLVHDTFMSAWKALTSQQGQHQDLQKESKNGLSNPASFKPWLMTIARNKARDFLHRKKIIAWLSLNNLGLASIFSEEQPAGDTEHIMQAIRKLPARQRECLILHIQGYGHREIAQILDVNEKNVAVNIYLAKSRLRKELKDSEDAPQGRRS